MKAICPNCKLKDSCPRVVIHGSCAGYDPIYRPNHESAEAFREYLDDLIEDMKEAGYEQTAHDFAEARHWLAQLSG